MSEKTEEIIRWVLTFFYSLMFFGISVLGIDFGYSMTEISEGIILKLLYAVAMGLSVISSLICIIGVVLSLYALSVLVIKSVRND